MANTVQHRRGNTVSINSHLGAPGEFVYNTTTKRIHAMDGSTLGGAPHALLSDLDSRALTSTTISAGAGLTGGGSLAANRTIALNSTSIASLAKADSSVQTVNGLTPDGSGNVTIDAAFLQEQNSVTTAIAESFASTVEWVRTAGYAASGDGGGALYKRVAEEPDHAGKFQSADGSWWEAASGATCKSRDQLMALSDAGFRLADGYIVETGDGQYIACNRPAGTQLIGGFDNAASISDGRRYVVSAVRTILGPNGERFVVKGVQMFDYLFASFEARDDNRYRKILQPVGKGPGTGISEPTYYARLSYKNREWVEEQIAIAVASGVNLIRVGVEPAVMFANVPYVDSVDGKTYPSDIEMLDTIIDVAANMGVVVQLQQSNDIVETPYNQAFLLWLMQRYFFMGHVWINPINEPLAYHGSDVHDPVKWADKLTPLVTTLTGDVPGYTSGTKWLNPVVIDPPSWSTRLDLVTSYLSQSPFTGLRSMIINTHIYGREGDYNFRDTQLPIISPQWLDAALNGAFCVVVGEVGINNLGVPLDPDLDPGVPSSDPTEWGLQQSFVQDFLNFASSEIPYSTLNGVIGHMWFAYIEGIAQHDYNSMRRNDGTWTQWGNIFRSYYLTPYQNTQRFLRKFTGLDINPVSTPSAGQPVFQVEGRTGARASMLQIMQEATDTYTGFYNRVTDQIVGTISGTSGGGVVYNTTSDERLKGGIRDPEPEEVIAAFEAMRPRKGHYLADPDNDLFLFVAHELQEAVPAAVTGERGAEKDGEPIYQMVDYSVPMPLVVAMLKIIWDEVVKLKEKN